MHPIGPKERATLFLLTWLGLLTSPPWISLPLFLSSEGQAYIYGHATLNAPNPVWRPALPLCGTQLCFFLGICLAPDLTPDAHSVLLLLTEHRSQDFPATHCFLLLLLGRACCDLHGRPLCCPHLVRLTQFWEAALWGSAWPALALSGLGTGQGGLHSPHVSSRDSLYLTQPMPKRQPPLPFLDLWFTCYSSSLPQLPWQQHTLGPAGKIPHSDLAPVPHGRQA